MSDREMSLPEYIAALGNSNHRAVQEYCDLIRKIEALEAKVKWFESSVEDGGGYLGSLVKQNAELEAENKRLKETVQRIYDNCSDTDLIIDIAAEALEGGE